MSEYKAKLNPFTGQLQLVSTNVVLAFKAGVASQASLPLTGNAKGDARLANDTGHLYVWSIDATSGLLTDWSDAGDIVDLTWDAISGKPSSSVANIDDAVSKKHTQGTDQGLDTGGANATTAAQVKQAVTDDHTHANKATLDNVSGLNTGDETAARIATIITGATVQTTPLDADEFPFYKIVGTLLSKVTWANIKATLKAYFDTLYELAGSISTHAGLTTGVHGVGAGTVAKVTDIAVDANLSVAAQDAVSKKHDGTTQADKHVTINEQIDSYVLVLTDDAKLIDMNKGTACTLTVPKNSSVAFTIGTAITVRQKGAGQVTIAPVDGDVTLNNPDGLKFTGQYGMATLIKVAENIWQVYGALEA